LSFFLFVHLYVHRGPAVQCIQVLEIHALHRIQSRYITVYLQNSAVHNNAVQYGPIQYRTKQYSVVQISSVRYISVHHSTVQYNASQQNNMYLQDTIKINQKY